MRRYFVVFALVLSTGCAVTDELGVDVHAKGELTYNKVKKHTLSVDGTDYTFQEIVGRDPDTGEVFVRIFEGQAGNRRIECVGSLAGCENKLRESLQETSQGD